MNFPCELTTINNKYYKRFFCVLFLYHTIYEGIWVFCYAAGNTRIIALSLPTTNNHAVSKSIEYTPIFCAPLFCHINS